MAWVFGTSTNYQTFADLLHNLATGSSLATLAINAAGSGYAVGDIVSISGGTQTVQGQAEVVSVGGGGAVTAVRIYNAGFYTVNPGTGAATTALTGSGSGLTLNTTIAANGWTSRRSTNVGGSGQREVIVEGSGSGSDQIFVGWRSYSDVGSGATNLELAGFTGFNSGLTWENQAGISPGRNTTTNGGAFVPLLNSTVTWWVSVNSRRIQFWANTSSCYAHGHLGLLNSFATSGEYPLPLYICGSTTERYRLPSTSTVFTSGLSDPQREQSSQVGPGLVRLQDGTWLSVANAFNSSSRTAVIQGAVVYPAGTLSGANPVSDDQWFVSSDTWASFIPQSPTQNARLLPTEDSGGDYFVRVPCTIFYSVAAVPAGVLGEIDGVFWFEAASLVVALNRLSEGSDRYRVFPNGVRTDNWALCAVKEA
jgi:hypothetical protein